MFKALVIWYNNKVASYLPSAINTMHAELRAAEMSYLENQKAAEEVACNAEMWAVKAKHDLKRCKRLQNWIDSEQASIDREKEKVRNAGLEAVMAEVAMAFAELDAAIADSEAEMQTKQMAEAMDATSPLKMSDDEFMKAAQATANRTGFKAKNDRKPRAKVVEEMGSSLKMPDTTPSGVVPKKEARPGSGFEDLANAAVVADTPPTPEQINKIFDGLNKTR